MSDQHIEVAIEAVHKQPGNIREEVPVAIRAWLDSVGLTLLALDNVDSWLEEVDSNRSDPEREQIARWAEAIRVAHHG